MNLTRLQKCLQFLALYRDWGCWTRFVLIFEAPIVEFETYWVFVDFLHRPETGGGSKSDWQIVGMEVAAKHKHVLTRTLSICIVRPPNLSLASHFSFTVLLYRQHWFVKFSSWRYQSCQTTLFVWVHWARSAVSIAGLFFSYDGLPWVVLDKGSLNGLLLLLLHKNLCVFVYCTVYILVQGVICCVFTIAK